MTATKGKAKPVQTCRMQSELEQLQAEVADQTNSVTTLLQKTLVIANKLGDKEFSAWATRELSGYSGQDDEATHRNLKGAYIVITAEGRRLPMHWEGSPSWTNSRFITLPVPELETFSTSEGGSYAVLVRVDAQSLQSFDLEPGDKIGFEIGKATLNGFLHSIRNMILDWTFGILSRSSVISSADDRPNDGSDTLLPAKEHAVLGFLKEQYLLNPSQRPARVCPEIEEIMQRFGLSKSQCYELAARLESLGIVEWVAKQANGEFLRIQPAIMEAVQTDEIQGTEIQQELRMDVLISWSKNQSREIAAAFHRWIPKVLPGVTPWMSDKDIDKGTDWWDELKGLLTRAKMCIICVSKENVRSPWLYFETGAIAGKGEGVRVCPYLLGIGPSMLSDGPLGKYQCTAATKEETLSLVRSLNRALDKSKQHDQGLLEGNFETKWPEFEAELQRVLAMDTSNADDFVATDADELAGYNLSSEARTLLVEASQDKHGVVMCIGSRGGTVVQTNGHNLVEAGNARSAAMWKQAIDDLVSYGLLEPRGHKGEVFNLTGKGYKVADGLKR